MPTPCHASRASKALAILGLVFDAGVVVVNAAANAVPLNGVTTAQLSDELPNLFVPAGITFAIWGVIYLLLAGYVVAALAEVFGPRAGAAFDARDGALLALNLAGNMAWIIAWQWRHVALSLGIMIVILATLVALSERIAERLEPGGALTAGGALRRFFLATPIRVYLGWICVATIANVTALLVKVQWDGFGIDPRLWTVLVIAAGFALAVFFIFARGASSSGLVVAWAYAGIVDKRLAIDPGYSRAVWIAALVAGVTILAMIAARAVAVRRASAAR